MRSVLSYLKILGIKKLAAISASTLLVASSLYMSINKVAAPDTVLYQNLNDKDMATVTDYLQKSHVAYTPFDDGHGIKVSADTVSKVRMQLAKNGFSGTSSVGYEIFDQYNFLTATDFDQKIAETRALEGELARSISTIEGVDNARVHIVLPSHVAFASSDQSAQASIIISNSSLHPLQKETAEGIRNLVSSAVPNLTKDSITIMNTAGAILSNASDEDDFRSQKKYEYASALEKHINQAVSSILAPIYGFNNLSVQSHIDVDFETIHNVIERIDPEQQVLRSQQTRTQKKSSLRDNTDASVANNLPNKIDSGKKDSNVQNSNDEVSTYEIGKTTSDVEDTQPKVKNITLSVVVVSEHEKSASRTEEIYNLVKNSSGINDARGDKVNIVYTSVHPEPLTNTIEKFHFHKEYIVYLTLPFALFVFARNLHQRKKDTEEIISLESNSIPQYSLLKPPSSSTSNYLFHEKSISKDALEKQIEENPERAINTIREWLNYEKS